MLRASNYHYKKGPVIVENLKILTINGRLFFMIFPQWISLRWEINYFLIYIYDIVLKNGQNVPLYIELYWYYCFYHISYWGIFYHFKSNVSNLCFLCVLCHNVLRHSKSSINFIFWLRSKEPAFICYLLVIRLEKKIKCLSAIKFQLHSSFILPKHCHIVIKFSTNQHKDRTPFKK